MKKEDFLWEVGMKDEVFLVDLSWVMYKSWYFYNDKQGLSVEIDGEEKPTGHIYGVLRTLMSMKEYNPQCSIVLCKDGIPEERREENEDYKADREHDLGYNIWNDLDKIFDMVFMMRDVYVAYNEKLEADDVIYSLAKKIEENIERTYVYIHSSDNDLLQTLSDRIYMTKKVSKNGFDVIDKDNLYEKKSMVRNFRYCPPEKLPFYRAIVGDKSDNLDGLYRFPRKLATMIAKRCENDISEIKDIDFEDLPEGERKPSYKKHLKRCKNEEFNKVKSNYNIMNLKSNIEFDLWTDNTEDSKERAVYYIDKLELNSYKHFLRKLGYDKEIGV